MMHNFLMWLTARLPAREITSDGRPYLERYFIGQLWGWTFYFHRFLASDPGRGLHDHPWNLGVSVLLAGKYYERYLRGITCYGEQLGRRNRYLFIPNFIRPLYWHRVILIKNRPVWTLFFHTAWVRHWGFLDTVQLSSTCGIKLERSSETIDVAGNSRWWKTAATGAELRVHR
jgi:hypothetical protein